MALDGSGARLAGAMSGRMLSFMPQVGPDGNGQGPPRSRTPQRRSCAPCRSCRAARSSRAAHGDIPDHEHQHADEDKRRRGINRCPCGGPGVGD